MAKSKPKPENKANIKIISQNRKASFQYELTDRLECGMVLTGTEVKSLRAGQAGLEGAFARLENGEVWLHGCEIAEYAMGNQMNHQPKRPRKLLLRRGEISKFAGKASERGFTLVPTKLYFKEGKAKVEIAVGKGKKTYDKRQAQKKADANRDIRRAMRNNRGK